MKHLIDPSDLTKQELDEIISLAERIIADRGAWSEALKGRKLATLFYEPSTRTRLSFTAAMMELGGNVLGFSEPASSSVSKGESVEDTVRVVGCFADVIAMRHNLEGAPYVASQVSNVPIINAGDGSHSHPTQTLTDLLTITREIGRIDGITIGFCGDLRFGRTVHSLIKALTKYSDIRIRLIAPDELRLPDYIKSDELQKCKGRGAGDKTQMHRHYIQIRRKRHAEEEERRREQDPFGGPPAEEGPCRRPEKPREAEYLEAHLYAARPEEADCEKR